MPGYDPGVEEALHRPPLIGRLPRLVWTVAMTGVAAVLSVVTFTAMPHGVTPLYADHVRILGPRELMPVAVLLASPVILAHRRPVAALALMLALGLGAAVWMIRPWPQYLAALVLLACVTATRPRRTGMLAAAAVVAVWTAEAELMSHGPHLLNADVGRTASVALAVAVAWLVGDSIRQRRAYGVALRAQATAQAVVAERLRIARELHDSVAHCMGVIAIQAGAARLVIDTQPSRAAGALSAIEATSRETLAGLRRMLVALRGTDPEPIAHAGLADVDRLAEVTAGAGLGVEVSWLGQRRPLPAEIELAAFRIVQESVTNVLRHADARRCQVTLDFRAAELAIRVADDGRGGAPDSGGYGIAGMRERVALLGGDFTAGPRPEGGFLVEARLPA
jgi:signal transduction histidine kinase